VPAPIPHPTTIIIAQNSQISECLERERVIKWKKRRRVKLDGSWPYEGEDGV